MTDTPLKTLEHAQKLLQMISLEGCIIQVGTKKQVIAHVTPESFPAFLERHRKRDLFFLGCVDPSANKMRANNSHVRRKGYVVLDFDIREWWKQTHGEELSDGEVKERFLEVIEGFKDHPFLANWCQGWFSGNGGHLYFCGEAVDTTDSNIWSRGVGWLIAEAAKLSQIPADAACTNPSRLMRLPGSINNKSARAIPTELLAVQEKVADLSLLLAKGKEEIARAKEEAVKSHPIHLKDASGDLYQRIQAAPIAPLVCQLFGWETNGRNFWEGDKRNKHKACFVPEDENFLVHGGTDHFDPVQRGFSPFELVKTKQSLSNADTFKWFREHFPQLDTAYETAGAGISTPNEPEEQIDPSQFLEMTTGDLLKILGATVKRDEANKIIAFLCCLSAYTDDGQFNVSFQAPSSAGKSYLALEIAELFPKEDILAISYASPQAFYHENGRFDEQRKTHIVDLERKIIVFTDQPHSEVLERLRPLLSHDMKEIIAKISDKSGGKHKTKTVVIRGFPSVLFCTASLKFDEQELTRFFLLSPETTQEKLREALLFGIKRKGNKQEFLQTLQSNDERNKLMLRIRAIRQANIQSVIIESTTLIEKMFLDDERMLKPRDQRDAPRFMNLVATFALVNFMHRRFEEGVLYANEKDYVEARAIWDKVQEAQSLNLSPYVFNLYKEIFLPAFEEYKVNYHHLTVVAYTSFS